MSTAAGDSVRITLPIVVMVAAVVAHRLADDPHPHRPPGLCLGRQSGGGEPHRHQHARACSSSPTAISASSPAIAGFIQAYRVHQAVPTAMAGQELNVLAVAILGGASLVGGIGTMGGVVLGGAVPRHPAERPQPARASRPISSASSSASPSWSRSRMTGLARPARSPARRSAVMERPGARHRRSGRTADLDRLLAGLRGGGAGRRRPARPARGAGPASSLLVGRRPSPAAPRCRR